LIFQLGTAKFGVRTEDGYLDDQKLADLAAQDQIKMIEIKLSQGAKPGKGGLPTGIKFCLGRPDEFRELVREMKQQKTIPDFITVDGGEGGTGAAPKSFMDDLGMPLLEALPVVQRILMEEGVRDQMVLFASGKLINAGRQLKAMAMGADVVYSARGFLLALGCIQALQCNKNTCPVGITTHVSHLQKGLDAETKSQRVANYVAALHHDFEELLAATGAKTPRELSDRNLFNQNPKAQSQSC